MLTPKAKGKAEKPRGRPTEYTPEGAAEICRRLADGESLRRICKDEHLPAESTVRLWVVDDREGFAAQYTRARDVGLDGMADEVIEIADELGGDAADKRVRFDARRWYLSKLAPKRYGDKVTQEHTGPDGGPIQSETSLDLSRLSEDQLRALASIKLSADA